MTHLKLKGVHLCCGGCTDAVVTAVESVPGAAAECDMENGTVTLTAPDDAAAQKALDAIADAGLHGETGDKHLAMKVERNVPPGKIQRLKVTGIHNCCQPCYQAIEDAIDSVEGVTDDTAASGKTTFEVSGDFHAAALLEALNAAGFHAKVSA
ncbi:MAG: heavy-metal-associated domain-containing protein [Gemmataceae bacterium]